MSLFRSRKPSPFEPQQRYNGLSYCEFIMLSDYNGERGRGITHTRSGRLRWPRSRNAGTPASGSG